MNNIDKNNPKIMGIGLFTLDVILNGYEVDIISKIAGGSMGNVTTILSFLGWSSYPIAYIGKDNAAKMILKDIRNWNVNTNYIYQDDNVSSPIIIEKIKNDSIKTHEFNFKCPLCNSKLPRNRTIPYDITTDIIRKMPEVQVFYLDRLSKSALNIAKQQKMNGSLIFFEPHKISKLSLFEEMLKITDILKYSKEDITKIPFTKNTILEIQSLGPDGVKYLFYKENDKILCDKISAYNTNNIIDTAGAGDWLTAGIIYKLGQCGSNGIYNLSKSAIENSLKFGQSLASLNCKFIGARGMMYELNKDDILKITTDIVKSKYDSEKIYNQTKTNKKFNNDIICPNCI